MPEKKFEIRVTYTGHRDFNHSYEGGGVTVGTVKLEALKFFEIEPDAKDKYELLRGAVVLPDDMHIRELGEGAIVLDLRRKGPVSKGV